MSKLSCDKYYDNFTKLYFSARWLVRAVIQNRDTRFLTEVESGFSSKIETIPPNSGRLDTLQGVLGGPGGMLPRKKIRSLRSSNCWKCTEIVNLTIAVSVIFVSF